MQRGWLLGAACACRYRPSAPENAMQAPASKCKEAPRHSLTAGFESRVAGHAAVDEERRPGDVVGHVRGEIDRSLRDIFRLADALVWNQLHQVRVGLRGL